MFFKKISFAEQCERLMQKLGIPEDGALDERTAQKTVTYRKRPTVVIVNSLNEKLPITDYRELKKLPLSPEQTEEALKTEVRFDGDHILVTDCEYQETDNIIYLEAVAAKYSTMQAIAKGKITVNQALFKTGVMTPIITNDKKVIFLERGDSNKLFSAPGGFLQPLQSGDTHPLVFNHTFNNQAYQADLVESTALKELHEEIFGSDGQLSNLALSRKLGMSMRLHRRIALPTMEFIIPVKTKQYSAAEFIELLNNNTATDADEHTGKHWVFDFSTAEAFQNSMGEVGGRPGYFLYLPMLKTIFPKLQEKMWECSSECDQALPSSMMNP